MRGLASGFMVCAATLLAVAGCSDATDVGLLEIRASGALVGQVYLDLDRSGSVETADRPLADIEVILSTAGTSATIATATTDATGVFSFGEVAAGSYRLRVDDAVLGDSLTTLTTLAVLEVSLGDTLSALVGVSYPQLTIEELRGAEPGRRVFTTGIALNVRDNPTDGRVFLEGESAFLQAIDIPRQPNVSVGDSVRFLGRTVVRDGQPMLQGDTVPTVILVNRAKIPIARTVSTTAAANAGGGPLDAALVRINGADISDTATVGDDFLFTADDGTGPLRVVLRPFLGRSTDDLRPDTTVRVERAVGMLSPHDAGTGAVEWRLLVRSAGELVTETRRSDLSVTTSFAPTSASQGEVVELTVVVANAGPLAANGVMVSDTLPSSLNRQSSSATQGSYSSSGSPGTWTLERIEPGAADTLTMLVEVTGAGTGTVTYVSRVGGLETEVDVSSGNNRATSALTLTAP